MKRKEKRFTLENFCDALYIDNNKIDTTQFLIWDNDEAIYVGTGDGCGINIPDEYWEKYVCEYTVRDYNGVLIYEISVVQKCYEDRI